MTYLADWIAKVASPELLLLTRTIDDAREVLDANRDNKSVSWVSLAAKLAVCEAVQERRRVRI